MIHKTTNMPVSKDTILYLRTLDNEIADVIKSLLNQEDFKNIKVR